MRSGLFLIASLVAALAVVATAAGEPSSVTAKRVDAQQVLAEIQAIDMQLDKAVDAYDGATVRLQAIDRDLASNRQRLVVAQANLAAARQRVDDRLVALYTSEEPDALTVLFGASSLGDLIDRFDSVNRISSEDARIAAQVARFRNEVQARERRLEQARASQQVIVGERAARRTAIERRLGQRQALLSSIKDEIATLQAAEQARQKRLAAQARARIAASPPPSQPADPAPPPPSPSPSPSPSPQPAPSPPPSSSPPPATHGGVVGIALRYLGVPYRWGGASPSGFDCSGFLVYVFAKVGVYLPHSSYMQFHLGSYVPRSRLQPGDAVFFNGASHVGIYIGGGQFVHAPHTGDVVKISSLSESWYSSTYTGARRY